MLLKSLILIVCVIKNSEACKIQSFNPFAKQQHIAALVLARGGSKAIPLKNLATIANHTLLNRTLSAISQVNFSSIWVSTDHQLILKEARNFNVHWRSKESATDEAASILGVLDFMQYRPEVDILALIQCTSPFIKTKYLKDALEWIEQGAECVFSATRSHSLRWKESNNNIYPLNFNLKNRPRRQDWNGELIENGMFYFTTRKLLSRGFLQSTKRKQKIQLVNLEKKKVKIERNG